MLLHFVCMSDQMEPREKPCSRDFKGLINNYPSKAHAKASLQPALARSERSKHCMHEALLPEAANAKMSPYMKCHTAQNALQREWGNFPFAN